MQNKKVKCWLCKKHIFLKDATLFHVFTNASGTKINYYACPKCKDKVKPIEADTTSSD